MIAVMMELVLVLIAHALVGIYSSTLKYSKKCTYLIWGTWLVFHSFLLYYAEFMLKDATMKFFVGFGLVFAGQYVIFFLTTKGRIAQRIFTILTYSVFFCIYMTLYNVVRGSVDESKILIAALFNAVMLFVLVFYFLRYVCPLCRTVAKNIKDGWLRFIFTNVIFLITVILSTVFPERLMNFRDPAFITFIVLSIAILAVYPIIFSSINSMAEVATKREVERQNKLLLTQIEAENARFIAESQTRHDIRHHNLVMLEFAKNNDIENVREYLKKLVESESESSKETRYCDNVTVNTVLSVYAKHAAESNIFVEISASASRELEIQPQDLVVVVANLFENAINACKKMEKEEKRINISIKEKSKRLIIKVENPCKADLIMDEAIYGIGICSVIHVTNKYDGMYDFFAEDGLFSAKVSLNLK